MTTWAYQKTIRREVSVYGVGLHTGAAVRLTLKPAKSDYGIRFCRTDLPGKPVIPARYDCVLDTSLATTIGVGDIRICTVEHLLAALRGTGIDNLHIDIGGPEVPILDGSAAPFVEIIRRAGLQRQPGTRKVVKIEAPICVSERDAFIHVWPSSQPVISYTIEFPHPMVGTQRFSSEIDPEVFAREVAGARTFGFLSDVKRLQDNGLALGGSLENALVFDDNGLLNAGGLRYRDECVRHKILDFIGDMALCPFPLIGRFEAHKAGHSLHTRLLATIMMYAEMRNWLIPASVYFGNSPPTPLNSLKKQPAMTWI